MGYLDNAGLAHFWGKVKGALAQKQDKLVGAAGQVVGFDAAGNPVAQSTASLVGPQGPQGPKGDTGADGAAGATGATGAKGDKGDPGLFYGTCFAAASTAEKGVILSGFALTAGAVVAVMFTNANTASSPTLNVNGTGAKAIKKYGTTAPNTYMWQAGAVVEFVYSGSYWMMLNGTTATTTYYGLTKLSSSVSSTSTTEAATPSAVKQAYDLASAAPTETYVNRWISLLFECVIGGYDQVMQTYVMLSGGHTALVCVSRNSNSGSAYYFFYNGTFSNNVSNSTLYLNPPPGYAFTGLADSFLPILSCNNQKVPGTIDAYGRYQFTLSSGMAGKTFTFKNGTNDGFVFLSMEVA